MKYYLCIGRYRHEIVTFFNWCNYFLVLFPHRNFPVRILYAFQFSFQILIFHLSSQSYRIRLIFLSFFIIIFLIFPKEIRLYRHFINIAIIINSSVSMDKLCNLALSYNSQISNYNNLIDYYNMLFQDRLITKYKLS